MTTQQVSATVIGGPTIHEGSERRGWWHAFGMMGRVLTLRITRRDIDRFDWRCLVLGLVCVWLVGVGRHWDEPSVEAFRRLGFASLAYACFMAGWIWLVARPLLFRPISYGQVLTFVAMTSPPGVVYAVPVDWWATADTTVTIAGFSLLFVAVYRVAMLVRFGVALRPGAAFAITLMPILPIVVVLGVMHLGQVIARGMGGIHEEAGSAAATFDEVIANVGFVALLAFPVVVLIYLWQLVRAHTRRQIRYDTLRRARESKRRVPGVEKEGGRCGSG